ncbi:cytochrome C oxidase subunit IV family protein [Niabella ginsengisoli]|uniref:Cytochrome C oxidase subunit IV family protein n=1 Tax=Niabella ginsengisoli TaxID=522298 RepID=A0ABS9SN05_9BACT|nr:cytochrome C oxidase subunit IV family protein [Niabella ginsengisoli]MCH5599739.1 cytochrome C oxidase subunit IV family protein [Niabella ginsengisoli]
MSSHYDPTKDISPSAAYPEVTVHHHHSDDATFKKRVKKTTILLSVITIIELAIGFGIYFLHKGEPPYFLVLFLKGIVCILTLAKAYYIVSVFMHLGDEIRNFMMTIVVPLALFIWFIIAFLADGQSYKDLRNKYDKHFEETTMPAPHATPSAEPAKGEGH